MRTTELIFILDKSGSMCGLEEDVIGGFNAMLEEQKEGEDKVVVSLVLFDSRQYVIYDRVSIEEVKPLTKKDYRVGSSTALLDTVGKSIRFIHRNYCETLKEERPDKVMFIINTDGYENCSREFSYRDIQISITSLQEKYDWEFMFLGANIDVTREGRRLGIKEERSRRFEASNEGVRESFSVMSNEIRDFRERPRKRRK